MKSFFLFYILYMVMGNPLMALVAVVIIYLVLDKAYLRLLPDFGALMRSNSRIRALKHQLDLNPSDSGAAKELGILYFERKKYNYCVEYLSKAMERITNSNEIYAYLGMAMIETGKADEGNKYIEQAVAVDKKIGYGLPYVYQLGYELTKAQPDLDRIRSLEEAVESFSNTENLYKMGLRYSAAKDKKKARDMYKLALKEYSYCPRNLKRLHRKHAILSKIKMLLNL